MMTLSPTWRYGANLGAPLAAIAYACLAQGLPFYSFTPVLMAAIFAVVQAVAQFFLFTAVYDHFVASGKERHYWLTLGLVYAFMGLGVVQLVILLTKPS
jgi:hypothetical protein